MLKRLVPLLVLALTSPLAAVDLESVLAGITSAQQEMETLQATFLQEKRSDFFEGVQHSRGVLYYRAPDKIRWEYASPSPVTILIDGDVITFYDHERKKVERSKVRKVRRKIQQYITATAPVETLKSYFTIYFIENLEGDAFILKLIPSVRRIEKHLEELVIHVDKTLYLPVVLQYKDPEGDLTRYDLQDIKVNQPLPEDAFTLALPDDVTIQEFQVKR